MSLQNSRVDLSLPKVMAILNVTPDSFYAKSRTFTQAEIEARVAKIVHEGADIIDIGGYSSRPNADDVSPDEEWRRVDRGIAVVRSIAPEMLISVDTFRAEVAEQAILKHGYLMINDISAGDIDSEMIAVAAKYRVPYIAMHMKGTPQTMQSNTDYNDVVEDVLAYFRTKVESLKVAGVEDVIIDLGFGFAKNVEQNYELLASMHRFCELGYPILAGLSRKSMIYKLLGTDASEALAGTIALNWESLNQGASIIRVHDVKEAADIVKVFRKFKGL